MATLREREREGIKWLHYLRVLYEDVLDEGLSLSLTIVHSHIVDLVSSDLAVLALGRRRAPFHLNGRGVDGLRLHPSRRAAGNYTRIVG